jgi:threonine dehydratase
MIGLQDIRAAADRIAGRVRRTPLIDATQLKSPVTEADLVLKLELLQVTGSFKARGATNCLLATPSERIERGIVAASGGNHGLAVVRAGALAGVPVTIFLPENVTAAKVEKLRLWGAETVITGKVWDETNVAAQAFVQKTGRAYFHPFADPLVVAGQGTVALEIMAEDPEIDTLLVAIGGGGLISGVAVAARALKPSIRVIGIEAAGSPTLKRSVEAGRVIGLNAVTTSVATWLAPARTSASSVLSSATSTRSCWLCDLPPGTALRPLRSGSAPARRSRSAALACAHRFAAPRRRRVPPFPFGGDRNGLNSGEIWLRQLTEPAMHFESPPIQAKGG